MRRKARKRDEFVKRGQFEQIDGEKGNEEELGKKIYLDTQRKNKLKGTDGRG